MQCPGCGQENPEAAKFCNGCGGRLERRCSACGHPNPAASRFCNECGQALAASSPQATPRVSSPDSYTPKHLAERILSSKAALEGERKQVTVLFADLKGSMELLADRDPEEARKLLDPVLEHMMEAVHRYEGTVNQVMGDGIMALFGAPLAQEDHAVRACYAALRMQESVNRYAANVFSSHGVSIRIRVGLNSGEVVVRSIGSDLHMDYTAVGLTTHLAARMEQLAEPGTTLFTPATLALAEGFVQVTARGPVPVKGLADRVDIFELTGASPVRSRLHAAAAHGLTHFVGREAEMAMLRHALTLARAGRGQVVAIVGEPGVGKSRLVWEFTHSHRSANWLVLEAASVSYGKATTYFPVIELLRGYFGIEPREDVRRIREKVTGKLLSLDRMLESTLPAFFALLDVVGDDPAWARLDPLQRRRDTLDALKRLLLRESQVQPLLLVFEDLHWIDTETQALLDLLVESLPTAAVVLVVNYRPEYTHTWGSRTCYQQVRLDALPAAGAAELLDALLGTDAGLAELKRLLIERTQGNPFFLEESVRALVETGALDGARGAYNLAGPLGAFQLPATAQAILAARIDRLSLDDKRLLQAAAVIGKDVPYVLLEAIADMPEQTLRAGLGRLQAAEFLYETRLFPELEYTFKHALTHEVAYGGILHERREALHARTVDAIERVHGERVEEYVEALGLHALRCGRLDKAVDYNRRAAAKARRRSSYTEEAAALERALEAVDRMPDERERLGLSADLWIAMRGVVVRMGQSARGLEIARKSITLADALGDAHRQAWAWAGLTNSLYLTGRMREAIEAGTKARALVEALGNPGSVLRVVGWYLAQACEAVGDHRRVIATANADLELLKQQSDSAAPRVGLSRNFSAIEIRAWLAWSLAQQGDFERAGDVARSAVALGELAATPWDLVAGYWGVSTLHFHRGELDEAATFLRRGVEICASVGIRVWEPVYRAHLGYVLALRGDLAGATALLSDVDTRVDQQFYVGLSRAWLGEVRLFADDLDDARRIADEALRITRASGQRHHEAWSLRLHGEIASAAREPSAAVSYRDALVIADELGMRPLVAHCHAGLAKLHQRIGKRVESNEHFAVGGQMYREMGMTYWLEKLEREIAAMK